MYYALAKNQDYYAERINRFIALTTCVYNRIAEDYEIEVSKYLTYDKLGIYNRFGGDESSATADKVCGLFSKSDCDELLGEPEYAASMQ